MKIHSKNGKLNNWPAGHKEPKGIKVTLAIAVSDSNEKLVCLLLI